MTFNERINDDLKKAMLAKDQSAIRTLRLIKAQFLLALTEKGADNSLADDKAVSILQKMLKQRQDSIAIFEQQNRTDLALTEKEEVDIIRRYLPEMMSDDQLRAELKTLVAELGVQDVKEIGKLMGAAMAKFRGKADGKAINNIAREILGA